MDQSAKKIGLINWIVLLVTAVALLLVSRLVNSAAGVLATILAGFGFLVSLLSYFQARLVEREHFERLEIEELSKTRGSASLFESSGADTFPAKRSREQFEKYFVPAFTVVLFLAQAAAAYFPWKMAATMPAMTQNQAALGQTLALLGLLMLALFLLGKYSAGLVRLQKQKLLGPSAAYLLLSAYACVAVAGSIVGTVWMGFPRVDFIVARALCVVAGLIALETLLGLILEIYRVRVKGREDRLLYESRFVGLLSEPEAIITTAAHALDYQFGFKVSETGFYRFLRQYILWLALAQFIILVLSSSVVLINTGDEALLERFGAPVAGREVLTAGLHFKLPWPVDQVRVYHTEQIQTFVVGSEPEGAETESTIVWSVAHAKEDNLLVAARERESLVVTNEAQKSPPVNLLSVSIPVQFQVTNLSKWAYVNEDPDELLRKLSTREVVYYLASADLDDLMSRGRAKAAVALRERIQAEADKKDLGARIMFVGLEDIHPPVKVAEFYEKIVAAGQTREAKILEAEAHALETNALARAEAFKKVNDAQSESHRFITNGVARAMLFTNQSLAYASAPSVYVQRAYLQTLVDNSRDARKYIIASTNTPSLLQLNLEEKIPDLTDRIVVPPDKK